MANYPTAHINAKPEDFAKTVLMPGDPLRSKFIAENFLENAVLVNNVRGVQGYTGSYKGKRVSVMASGMGVPSIGIYTYELYNFFEVENIIRIGSTGALVDKVNLRDIVFAMGVSTDSEYQSQYGLNGHIAPLADYELLSTAVKVSEEKKADFHVGNVLCSDVFYNADPEYNAKWARMGALCVEMESTALYLNAAYAGKRALSMFTVSDQIVRGEHLSSEERQTSFTQMMEIALETAVRMD